METCIETGIIYYEYMIDLERADHQIKEECLMKYINESDSLYLVEGAKIDAAIKFIKSLFTRIVEAFKKMIQTFSKLKSTYLKPNMKLVRACEDKIKSMSISEQNDIVLKKVMYSNNMKVFVEFLKDNNPIVTNILAKLTTELEECNRDDSHVPNVSDNDIQTINQIDKSYDRLSDKETLTIDMEDANFSDIRKVLDEYKKSADSINTVTDALIKSQKNAEKCKQKVDKLASKEENINDEFIKQLKVVMINTANLTIKISKGIIETSVGMFKNDEKILNAFINWKTNTESFYFEDEDVLYLI